MENDGKPTSSSLKNDIKLGRELAGVDVFNVPTRPVVLTRIQEAGLSEFPKTTLQYEGDDDVNAMMFFLEIRKYGHLWEVESSFTLGKCSCRLPTSSRMMKNDEQSVMHLALARGRAGA